MSEFIGFRAPDGTKEALQKMGSVTGKNISEFIVTAVFEALKKAPKAANIENITREMERRRQGDGIRKFNHNAFSLSMAFDRIFLICSQSMAITGEINVPLYNDQITKWLRLYDSFPDAEKKLMRMEFDAMRRCLNKPEDFMIKYTKMLMFRRLGNAAKKSKFGAAIAPSGDVRARIEAKKRH